MIGVLRRAERPVPSRARPAPAAASIDERPWRHPYLTVDNIRRFRRYSEQVWSLAHEHAARDPRPLRCAFTVNMAQTMYTWARLARKHGADATLIPHPLDHAAISMPEWEDYDGDFEDVLDGEGFRRRVGSPELDVPCRRVNAADGGLQEEYQRFRAGDRRPLLGLLARAPDVRHEVLVQYAGVPGYFEWARALAEFDVIQAASSPIAAYASGRPYCVFSVGGDLMYDCGRPDEYGQAMVLAFNAARFMLVTNPHPLAHCRRLGLTNALYLPCPVDDERYGPGAGGARPAWQARCGPGVFVLSTARLDRAVKGQDEQFFAALVDAARRRAELRFVFLAWGADVEWFRARIHASGLSARFLLLPPVGKRRLLDYYRSADVVLDQMVYGYYGATALEAAAVGKPVVMKLRADHYEALYAGDAAPVVDVQGPAQLADALTALAADPHLRESRGRRLREWLVRTHGEERLIPLLLAVLRLAAGRVTLPADLVSPLADPEAHAERDYHKGCLELAP